MAVVIADAVAEVGVSGRDGTALLRQDGDQVAVLLVSANAELGGEETGYGGFG